LADAAVTILNSDIQIKNFDRNKKTALVSMGTADISTFQKTLKPEFNNSLNFILPKDASESDIANVKAELKNYDQIIVSIHDLRKRPAPVLDYNAGMKLLIADIAQMNSMFAVFANPYTIAGLPGIEAAKTIIINYQNTVEAQNASSRLVKGQLKANGKLPVTINSWFKNGDGLSQN